MNTWVGLSLAMAIAAVLSAVALSGVAGAAESRAAAQTLIYQTNWRHGKLGWSSDDPGDWHVVGRLLTYTPVYELSGTIYAPVQPKGSFAVQATIRRDQEGGNNANNEEFGVLVRSTPAPEYNYKPGVAGGVRNQDQSAAVWVTPNGVDQGNETVVNQSDFDPGSGWHTYRLEVRGISYRLLVDGQMAATGRTSQDLSAHRVGLFAIGNAISVRGFKVFSLR